MTQEQAIAMAERALAKAPSSRVFAIPFTNRRDYDRAEDAFTDIGCITGEDVALSDPPPFNPACRSIQRLRAENGDNMELYVLEVAIPPKLDPLILKHCADCR